MSSVLDLVFDHIYIFISVSLKYVSVRITEHRSGAITSMPVMSVKLLISCPATFYLLGAVCAKVDSCVPMFIRYQVEIYDMRQLPICRGLG